MWRADASHTHPLPMNTSSRQFMNPSPEGLCACELISQPNPLWENELSSVLTKLSDALCAVKTPTPPMTLNALDSLTTIPTWWCLITNADGHLETPFHPPDPPLPNLQVLFPPKEKELLLWSNSDIYQGTDMTGQGRCP